MGPRVGDVDGDEVGFAVVGASEGFDVSPSLVGDAVGDRVGVPVGQADGDVDGLAVRDAVSPGHCAEPQVSLTATPFGKRNIFATGPVRLIVMDAHFLTVIIWASSSMSLCAYP